jgi:hypothetical protein
MRMLLSYFFKAFSQPVIDGVIFLPHHHSVFPEISSKQLGTLQMNNNTRYSASQYLSKKQTLYSFNNNKIYTTKKTSHEE